MYSCQVIPNRGAWLEYETDANDIFYVKVDRNKKVPITVLIRALGFGTNAEILDILARNLSFLLLWRRILLLTIRKVFLSFIRS